MAEWCRFANGVGVFTTFEKQEPNKDIANLNRTIL